MPPSDHDPYLCKGDNFAFLVGLAFLAVIFLLGAGAAVFAGWALGVWG
ncbi:MAG TPA: hypothetical protein VLA00_14775 [Xanthobacteraceae bacterium]|nr:hypothetical protein [Xanthobacteraceae bacterium]